MNKPNKLIAVVEDIVKKFSPISIELSELYYKEKPNGSRVYAIRVKKTPEIQRLHENLMNELRQYFTHDCTRNSLFSKTGEEVTEPDYINKFSTLYSFEAFDPHITIRTKEAAGEEILPLKFVATKVAACHVGIMTTCRKELFTVEMTTKRYIA